MPVLLRAPATAHRPELALRPWCDADIAELIEVYRDPELRRWVSHPVDDVDGARRWVTRSRQGWAAGSRFSFAVLEPQPAAADRLVATVVLKNVLPGREHAEVGYWTAAWARGRGVAPRAVETVTGWAFARFAAAGLTCLELLHQVDNLASCRVAEKTGYLFQEVLPARAPFPRDGHRHVRRAPAIPRHAPA
ncbi:GNAT family N-acetyltransferase [Micromonospora sp. NBC_01655]|uniref:GNAT family N-acetyltransferase n=1 Tax=Micromonospora sp. NBC_01655 TaxID=2975983 RepID=UPI002254C719|nr:GNAT family N-acetyltransferase [Micromonospora sp. NBC_01655]MCX4472381.1 GNAT family N-acetyltransferase [Micromonospora sp. NBC_01655]